MNLSDVKVIAGLPQMVGRATPCAPDYMNVPACRGLPALPCFNTERVRDEDG
jgi:hypothetical protein